MGNARNLSLLELLPPNVRSPTSLGDQVLRLLSSRGGLLDGSGEVGALRGGKAVGEGVKGVDEGTRRPASGGVGEEGRKGVRERLGPDGGGGDVGLLVLGGARDSGGEAVRPDPKSGRNKYRKQVG